jgi:HEAT repeat protein
MRYAPRLPIVVLGFVGLVAWPDVTAQDTVDPKVKALMEQLRGEDWGQRTMAASMLAQLGPAAVPAIPLLLEPLKDARGTARIYRSTVPITLGIIGPPAKSAIPALVELLKAEDPEPDHPEANLWTMARANAAYALGTIGPADRPTAVAALLDATRDTRGRIRANALVSLQALGLGNGPEARAAVPVLVQVLEDWKDLVESQQAAAELLGAIGPTAHAAVPALTGALESRNEGVRAAAADALKKVQAP